MSVHSSQLPSPPLHHNHGVPTHDGDRDLGGMRKDELNLLQSLPPAPVLDGGDPTVAGIAQAVDEDDGGRVLGRSRENERSRTSKRHYGDGGRMDGWWRLENAELSLPEGRGR